MAMTPAHLARARALHALLNSEGCEWTHGGSDGGASCYSCSLIAAALVEVEAQTRAAVLALADSLEKAACGMLDHSAAKIDVEARRTSTADLLRAGMRGGGPGGPRGVKP